jgi:hypothetical protein
MRNLQKLKAGLVIPPQIVKNASVTGKINTQGYASLLLLLSLGATDVNITTLKLEGSDDDATYTAIPRAEYGLVATATDSATPALPVVADANSLFAFDVTLDTLPKWVRVIVTAPNGTNGALVAVTSLLDRYSGQLPDGVTERGYKSLLSVPAQK